MIDPFGAFKGLDKKSRSAKGKAQGANRDAEKVLRKFKNWPRIVTIWKGIEAETPAIRIYMALAQRWEEIHGEYMDSGVYHEGEGKFVLTEIFKSPLMNNCINYIF